MMKIILILLLISFNIVWADGTFNAKVYHQETGELLYLHYNTINNNDSTIVKTHFYLHPDSSLAVMDKVILKKDKPWKFNSKFVDTAEESSVILSEGSLQINYENSEEQVSKSIEFEEKLLAGPLFNDFVQEKWNNLLQGEVEKFHLPAPRMLTTGKFYLKQLADSEYNKPGLVVFKMGVSSIFLRLLIKPSYFVYDTQTKRLQRIHGLTILPHKKNGEWSRTTNADIYYEYE